MDLFHDKRVLVTGGAGFIGTCLLQHFLSKYPHIYFVCVDKLNYASKVEEIKRFSKSFKNFRFCHLDLSQDLQEVINLVRDYGITDIINLAAESSVDRSFLDPVLFTKNNVIATQNLLECLRLLLLQINYFLHMSTDEVYGETQVATEESALNPTNPYSASKALADLLIQAYKQSFQLPITIIRPNNVFGPNQFPEKLIPLVMQCGQTGKKVPIHGTGKNKRLFLYISDLLDAIEMLFFEHRVKSVGEIYNVGHSEASLIENREVVHQINEIFGFSVDIEYVRDRKYNDKFYSMNTSKIYSLGWTPKVSLRRGLQLIKESQSYGNAKQE